MLETLNHTHLVLIPKVSHPESIDQFRPIGLCNFSYKVIARVVTNHMKSILGNIIDKTQSAFIPNRLITDNILIAHELIHFLKRKKKGKDTYMQKAYDRIEWNFVRTMMRDVGFSEKWTNLIMEFITRVSYTIKINEQVRGDIKPSRGLRQGDPL